MREGYPSPVSCCLTRHFDGSTPTRTKERESGYNVAPHNVPFRRGCCRVRTDTDLIPFPSHLGSPLLLYPAILRLIPQFGRVWRAPHGFYA